MKGNSSEEKTQSFCSGFRVVYVGMLAMSRHRIAEEAFRCAEDDDAACSGNGRCEAGRCMCTGQWTGPTCSQRGCWRGRGPGVPLLTRRDAGTCPGECSGHGACNDGTCVCADGFVGEACSEGRSTASATRWCELTTVAACS